MGSIRKIPGPELRDLHREAIQRGCHAVAAAIMNERLRRSNVWIVPPNDGEALALCA